MKRPFQKSLRIISIALLLHSQAWSATPDQTAKLVAGLQPTSADSFSEKAFLQYAKMIDSYWSKYETKVFAPMTDWAKHNVKPLKGDTIFYPFSGPDFPTIYAMAPGINRYILISIQRAGTPIQPDDLSPANGKKLLDHLASDWSSYTQMGFFKTIDLDKNASESGVKVTPTLMMMAFASRLGFTIESVTPIKLNDDNSDVVVDTLPGRDWPSVRIQLKKDGKGVIVDYLRIDLSDYGLNKNPTNRKFIEKSARWPMLFKAASHLPQDPAFSIIKNAALTSAPLIIQDETGIEYSDLKNPFSIKLFGRFSKPHHLFSAQHQKSLAAAYADDKSAPTLPFRVGYMKDSGFSLQVAVRKDTNQAATPAAAPILVSPPAPEAAVATPRTPTTPPSITAAKNDDAPKKRPLPAAVEKPAPRSVAPTGVPAKRETRLFLSPWDETPEFQPYLKTTSKRLQNEMKTVRENLKSSQDLILTVMIQKDGTPRSAEIEKSSGDVELDKQAIAKVLKTKNLSPLPSSISDKADLLGLVIRFTGW